MKIEVESTDLINIGVNARFSLESLKRIEADLREIIDLYESIFLCNVQKEKKDE